MLLDEIMPVYHFQERHAIRVHAPGSRVFRAVKEVTPAEIPLLRLLLAIRSLPASLAGRSGWDITDAEPLFAQALREGFVFLAERPDRELVFGRIGQFWNLSGGTAPGIGTLREFLAFEEPGYGKAAANFSLDGPDNVGRFTLTTETRVFLPDPATRRRFAVYWRVIRAGSALIRRMWLKAIKRRAESG